MKRRSTIEPYSAGLKNRILTFAKETEKPTDDQISAHSKNLNLSFRRADRPGATDSRASSFSKNYEMSSKGIAVKRAMTLDLDP